MIVMDFPGGSFCRTPALKHVRAGSFCRPMHGHHVSWTQDHLGICNVSVAGGYHSSLCYNG